MSVPSVVGSGEGCAWGGDAGKSTDEWLSSRDVWLPGRDVEAGGKWLDELATVLASISCCAGAGKSWSLFVPASAVFVFASGLQGGLSAAECASYCPIGCASALKTSSLSGSVNSAGAGKVDVLSRFRVRLATFSSAAVRMLRRLALRAGAELLGPWGGSVSTQGDGAWSAACAETGALGGPERTTRGAGAGIERRDSSRAVWFPCSVLKGEACCGVCAGMTGSGTAPRQTAWHTRATSGTLTSALSSVTRRWSPIASIEIGPININPASFS